MRWVRVSNFLLKFPTKMIKLLNVAKDVSLLFWYTIRRRYVVSQHQTKLDTKKCRKAINNSVTPNIQTLIIADISRTRLANKCCTLIISSQWMLVQQKLCLVLNNVLSRAAHLITNALTFWLNAIHFNWKRSEKLQPPPDI